LDRGRPQPHAGPPKDPEPPYPAWLLDGWKARDRWRAEGAARLAPRVLRQWEASLLRAEHDWRAGVDARRVQEEWLAQLPRPQDRLGRVRTVPHPRPASLALTAVLERPPDEAIARSLRDLL